MHRCTLWRNLTIIVGSKADYEILAPFHYRVGRPVAVTRIWVARFCELRCRPVIAGVLVESRPILNCALRNVATSRRYLLCDKRAGALLLNREVTSIARVIVHPTFRGIGVAKALVVHALCHARTPCVEALAAMGPVQPFFERAGMSAFRGLPGKPVYYLWRREP